MAHGIATVYLLARPNLRIEPGCLAPPVLAGPRVSEKARENSARRVWPCWSSSQWSLRVTELPPHGLSLNASVIIGRSSLTSIPRLLSQFNRGPARRKHVYARSQRTELRACIVGQRPECANTPTLGEIARGHRPSGSCELLADGLSQISHFAFKAPPSGASFSRWQIRVRFCDGLQDAAMDLLPWNTGSDRAYQDCVSSVCSAMHLVRYEECERPDFDFLWLLRVRA